LTHKISGVLHTDTIIYPRTVMVPSFYTSITNTTMVGAGSCENFATCADIIRVEIVQ